MADPTPLREIPTKPCRVCLTLFQRRNKMVGDKLRLTESADDFGVRQYCGTRCALRVNRYISTKRGGTILGLTDADFEKIRGGQKHHDKATTKAPTLP